MTPKEKAKDLFQVYLLETGFESFAKKCSLIAVDEIIGSGLHEDYYFDKSVGYIISYVEYYQEIKQEIQKL